MAKLEPIVDWLENRSPTTRWILVPFVFLTSSILIFHLVSIITSLVSFLPSNIGQDAEVRLVWFQETIFANAASTYGAAMLSGWVAPKSKFTTVCIGSSFFLIGQLLVIYSMVTTTSQDLWNIDDVWVTLSVIAGAIAAIVHAKDNFHE